MILFHKRLPLLLLASSAVAFSPPFFNVLKSQRRSSGLALKLSEQNPQPWKGEVVANSANGGIRGCSVEPVGGPPTVEWTITIDGEEADLGRFSEAIYKKITTDAKQERFQGFRPGTIPPHLLGTYKAFAMDECARETVLEAMQQNNIRPFDDARSQIEMDTFFIPPPKTKKSKQKKVKKKKQGDEEEKSSVVEEQEDQKPEWRAFNTMKEALDAGWQPGQSFSFVARKVKGQKVKPDADVQGASPLGLNY